MESSKQSLKEYLYVFVILLVIYVPTRYLFATYIAEHWLGSFGILSTITVLLIYLAEKQKLGRFGRLFLKRMNKVQTGKKKYLIYGNTIFWILIWTAVVTGIHEGKSTYAVQTEQISTMVNSPEGQKRQEEVVKNMTPESTAKTFLFLLLLPILKFDAWSILITMVDQKMNGYLDHFSVIFLVESFEALGMLIYIRIKTKNQCQTR
jgi:hypothetical protein